MKPFIDPLKSLATVTETKDDKGTVTITLKFDLNRHVTVSALAARDLQSDGLDSRWLAVRTAEEAIRDRLYGQIWEAAQEVFHELRVDELENSLEPGQLQDYAIWRFQKTSVAPTERIKMLLDLIAKHLTPKIALEADS
ncbi:hypothetical protein K0U83_25985 [bacterium]|nr:hypothetical protein [bacterium]